MADPETELKVDISNLGDAVAPNGHDKDKDAPKIEVVTEAKPDAEEPKPKAGLTPEEGIQKLQRQLDEERAARASEAAARQDAERRAQEATEGELRAKTDNHQSQLDMLGNAIANLTSANDLLKSKYSAALAAQDFDTAASAQLEMSTNAAKLVQLESGKANLERAGKPAPRVAPVNPVDRFVSTMTPRSASWVRAHPEFVTDTAKNNKMMAAHYAAIGDGHAPDSDQYFEAIEQTLGLRQAPQVDDEPVLSDAARPKSQRTPPPAAPVSRSGKSTGGRPNVVTLSSDEVEIAKMNGMTPEEYARNKYALQKEGRLN
jgi:hypothetical protein